MDEQDRRNPFRVGPLQFRSRPLLAIGCGWTLVAVLCGWLGNVRYFTNDDVAMTALASGSYAGAPGAHLVYVGFLPGLVVKWAYLAIPTIPWYALLHYACAVAGLTTTSWTLWICRGRLRAPLLIPATALTLIWASVLFMRPSFTFSGFALAIGACCAVSAMPVVDDATRSWSSIGAGVLLGLSGSIRWDSMIGAIAVGLPLIVAALIRSGRRATARFAIAAIASILLVAASNAVANRPDDWAQYVRFNSAREELHATGRLSEVLAAPDDPAVVEMLRQNEWSINDVWIFASWMIEDPNVYDATKLERLVETSEEPQFATAWGFAWGTVVKDRTWMVLGVLLCAVLAAWHSRRAAVPVVAQVVWASAIAVYVARTQRFPERVALPLSLLIMLTTLFHAALPADPDGSTRDASPPTPASWRSTSNSAIGWLAATVLLITTIVPLIERYSAFELSRSNGDAAETLNGQVAALNGVDPDGRFLLVGSAVMLDGADVFAVDALWDNDQLLWSTWLSQSPPQVRRLSGMGFSQDLLRSLIDSPHRYLVIRRAYVEYFETAYRERLGVRAKFVRLGDVSGRSSIYAVRSTEGSTE